MTDMIEEWRPVVGYEGDYEVSNLGRVRNARTLRLRTCKVNPTTRYVMIGLYRSMEGQKTLRVHRMVAQAFIPNPDGKGEVNHIDCDRANNAATNLEWATKRENIDHAIAEGRYASSVICPWQKITPADELLIRADRTVKAKVLAERYGVTPYHINRIRCGRSRRALKPSTAQGGRHAD